MLILFASLLMCCTKYSDVEYPSEIKTSKQFVILKADDIIFNGSIISSRWILYFDFIKSKNIKSSLGLIGNSLEKGNNAYYSLLKNLNSSGNFELWNHGYTHTINAIDENGNLYNEFRNTSIQYQKEHLLKTQNLAKEKLNITLKTFGAPGNGVDNNTVTAMKDIDDIKVWFFGIDNTTSVNLKRSQEIEFPTGNPSFIKFQNNYDSKVPLLILQIHPNSWDETMFNEFRKTIDFLIQNDVIFINPYEYFNTIYSRALETSEN